MKKLILLALVLFSAATMLAQTNRMSYQAVVRNAANELVAEENLTVAIRISDANSTSAFSETHSVTSNRNGVISLMIGEGSGQSGSMASVDWRTAQIHTVVTLPGGATLSNTTPVNAVPYAFYADSVDIHWVNDAVDDYLEHHSIGSIVETDPTVPDWAKEATKPVYDYSEITNTPTIPTNVGELTNDANYITLEQVPAQVNADWNATEGAAQILNKPELFSGDYNDLTNTPTIPTVPTNVGAFTNDAGYITAAEVPAVSVPTNVSAFNNDAEYVTTNQLNAANYITAADVPAQVNADWNATEGAAQILNKPELFSGDYNDLTNAPTIPTVPTNVSEFNNDAEYVTTTQLNAANYITAADVPAQVNADWNATEGAAQILNKPELFSGDYNDLTNKPTIPTVPTNVGAFTNDAGYITAEDIPAISSVPTNVSAFDNDANYITNSNNSCASSVDLCELLEKLELLENQLEPIMILTQGVTAVTQNSFTVNGKVQTDGSTTVSQRGFVYSSSNPNPTLDDSHVNSGSGNGTFTSTITGLTAGITYYVRAYATNQNGTFYGSEVAVTTTATSPSTVPSVTTIAVTDVGKFRATVSGSVTSDGGENVTQRGFVYGTSSNPTTSNSMMTSGGGTGNFTILLSRLQAGTIYYVRAFAVNSKGTAYGNQLTFNTTADEQPAPVGDDGQPCAGTPTVTDHEGNVYNTVQIGSQCWTKENMRATTSPSTGTYLIPPTGTSYTYSGKQAHWYNNDSANYAPMNYGLLYNWNAAVDTFNTTYGETSVISFASYAVYVYNSAHRRGICPQGWHVPSDVEWTTLINYLGSHENYYYYDDESYDVPVTNTSYVAKALASTQGWDYSSTTFTVGNNQGTNNASGFSAVPAGTGVSSFYYAGSRAYFWSSGQSDRGSAIYRTLSCSSAAVDNSIFDRDKTNGYSVRCLRDNDVPPTSQTQPTVTTSAATNITSTSAMLNGNVSNPDNVAITAQGFEWKATTSGAYVAVNATGETMTYNLTGLTAGTSYTYRAFVTTAEGTNYGEAVSFTTLAAGGGAVEGDAIPCPGTPTVTDHEGNVYATVQIGNQCWMRDNLRTTTSPSTGTYLIPAANANYTFTGKQARWYSNDSATYAPMNYGLLYNWNAAVDTFNTAYGETSVITSYGNAVSVTFNGHRRGICPVGWHLPSDAEWTQLTNYVGSQSEYTCSGNSNYIAKALASTEGWNSYSGECYPGDQSVTANNATGFSAVPAGICDGSSFDAAGILAYFVSATQPASNPSNACNRYLYSDYAPVTRGSDTKATGFSVRCLRD